MPVSGYSTYAAYLSNVNGFQRLQTHIFDGESQYLDSDAVFAVKQSLIREFVPRTADDPEKPASIQGEWCSVKNDIVLAPLTRGATGA